MNEAKTSQLCAKEWFGQWASRDGQLHSTKTHSKHTLFWPWGSPILEISSEGSRQRISGEQVLCPEQKRKKNLWANKMRCNQAMWHTCEMWMVVLTIGSQVQASLPGGLNIWNSIKQYFGLEVRKQKSLLSPDKDKICGHAPSTPHQSLPVPQQLGAGTSHKRLKATP